jgi:hypothetical protein
MDLRVWGLRDRRANRVQQRRNAPKDALLYDEGGLAARKLRATLDRPSAEDARL